MRADDDASVYGLLCDYRRLDSTNRWLLVVRTDYIPGDFSTLRQVKRITVSHTRELRLGIATVGSMNYRPGTASNGSV